MARFIAESTELQVNNYFPGNTEQLPRRGNEASPQSGLGVGCKRCSSSKKLNGLSALVLTRRVRMLPSFSAAGVSSFLSPPRSATSEARRSKVHCGVSVRGALCLIRIYM